MGVRLVDDDEGIHAPGVEVNWNESRYVDVWDPAGRVGGWFRIGNRPNANYAEMSVCLYLPDGRVAFGFQRAPIEVNGLEAGGQSWAIVEPWRRNQVSYRGDLTVFEDPWALTNPKAAFAANPSVDAEIDLECHSTGLDTVMGQDQDHKDLIFLPGQADFHYQHLARTTGTIRLGTEEWRLDGLGGKDHSWGPRNWHAKRYLRWLTAGVDDDNGFMLTRAVGPTKKTRSGFVLDEGKFHVVDDFVMANTYAGPPHYELTQATVEVRSGDQVWTATGTPQAWLPVRHRQPGPDGEEALLRIVKSPADWVLGDGRSAAGHFEYHDLMVDGRPVGLDD